MPDAKWWQKERLMSLGELTHHINIVRNKGTLRNYIKKGVWVDGVNIKMEAKRISGVYHSSVEAYFRFIDAQNQS